MPTRQVGTSGIYEWVPGQNGYTVYGNRRQNFSQYRINSKGYNSYREFTPTKDKIEIAIIGDSYIEGFHQDYFRSIGNKIEQKLGNSLEVYEYGHSSNDLADQLYLIYKNKNTFDLIDYTIIGLKYENDLRRAKYEFIERKPFFPLLRKSKLLVYLLGIGILDPLKDLNKKLRTSTKKLPISKAKAMVQDKDSLYLENFKSIIAAYGFDRRKTALLLDSRVTNAKFLEYLKNENIRYIDFANSFEKATNKPTTLIYDQHWNNFGRELIANEIVEYINEISLIK